MKRNLTPWLLPVTTRKALALSAKSSGQKLALLLYPSPDASTFRYRGYNLFRASELSPQWQLVYFFSNELSELASLIPQSDLLIYSRVKPWSYTLDDLAALAHQHHVPVLNDLDDCVCGQYHIKEMFNTVAPDETDREYWINTSAQFELVSYACDGFLVTNDYLGQTLSATHHQKPYYVINNSFNQEQLDYSEFLIQHKKHCSSGSSSSVFTMGYFSGSATHAADLEVIYPELLRLLSDNTRFRFRLVGKMQLPASAKPFIKNGQIELYPIVDFLELQRLISEVDVNLAPLTPNIFTNCKSELKYFEAAIVHTPTIASPTFAFRQAIQHQVTGFLCQPGQWYDCIMELSQQPSLANSIATQAYTYCLKTYSPQATAQALASAFNQAQNLLK